MRRQTCLVYLPKTKQSKEVWDYLAIDVNTISREQNPIGHSLNDIIDM